MRPPNPIVVLFDSSCSIRWLNYTDPSFAPEDVVGHAPWEFLHASDLERFQAAMLRVLSEASTEVIDFLTLTGQYQATLYPLHVGVIRVCSVNHRWPDDVQLLTGRQREVCAGFAAGLSSKEVAIRLDIAHSTVDNHRSQIAHKIGVFPASLEAWCGEHRAWLG